MSFSASAVEAAFRDEAFESYSTYWANKGRNGWISVDSWSMLGDGDGRVTINGETYDWKGVEWEGGGEGSGEHTHIVFKIETPEGDRFFKKDGYYASHYGTDWDGDFNEVEQYEKTITDWRRISS